MASFVFGLRADSRLVMKQNNMKMEPEQMLLASITDKLSVVIYMNDQNKNKTKPKLILGEAEEKDMETFASADEYEEARRKLLGEEVTVCQN